MHIVAVVVVACCVREFVCVSAQQVQFRFHAVTVVVVVVLAVAASASVSFDVRNSSMLFHWPLANGDGGNSF